MLVDYGVAVTLEGRGNTATDTPQRALLSPDTPNSQTLSILASIEIVGLFVVFAIAAVILLLWFTQSPDTWPPPIWSQMTANAAVGMCAAAASLAFSHDQRPGYQPIARGAAYVVVMIGLLSLSEYTIHASIGVDAWLPHGHIGLYPGRPSPQTSIGFVLLGACVLTIDKEKGGGQIVADSSALALLALVLLTLGGYLYGALGLTGLGAVTVLSPQTLLSFVCLTLVMVVRRARRGGLFGVLVNAGIGSRIVRAVLPAATILPLLFFATENYIIEAGVLPAPYAHAIGSTAASLFILCLVSWMGRRLNAFEGDLREASLVDALTSVNNRRGFYFLGRQAVRDAERARTGLTLFFFDLNGLKFINDTLGHDAGSNAIQEFASAIKRSFRKTDIIGRVGGDEFAALTIRDEGIQHKKVLAQVELFMADCSKTDPMKPRLTFSVGITEFMHGAADSLDAMLARADTLMYQDKAKKHLGRPSQSIHVEPCCLRRNATESAEGTITSAITSNESCALTG